MESIRDWLIKNGYFRFDRFMRTVTNRDSKHSPYTRKKYDFTAKKKARKVAYQSRKINRQRKG